MVSGGVVERGFVKQGHASRLCLALGAGRIRACLADCWSESFGCGGLTLASELGQSQLPDVSQKPASKGNSSTIAMPCKQCQTQKTLVTRVFQSTFADACADGRIGRPASGASRSGIPNFALCLPSATLPFAMDYLW